MQRLRITFCRGEELKYISHLDMMRLWQRVIRRAGLPVAYSEGFSPQPRLSIGAPLAVGVTSEGELMDLYLKRRVAPFYFMKVLKEKLPKGLDVREVEEVPLSLPSLQSLVRFAEYKVKVPAEKAVEEVHSSIEALLALERLPWEHKRDTEVRRYDLRALIDDIWLEEWSDSQFRLGLRLRADSSGTGRPEQVVAALGFTQPPISIHRTRLTLARRGG